LTVAKATGRGTSGSSGSQVTTNTRSASAMRASGPARSRQATPSSASTFSWTGGLTSTSTRSAGRPENGAAVPVLTRTTLFRTGANDRQWACVPLTSAGLITGPGRSAERGTEPVATLDDHRQRRRGKVGRCPRLGHRRQCSSSQTARARYRPRPGVGGRDGPIDSALFWDTLTASSAASMPPTRVGSRARLPHTCNTGRSGQAEPLAVRAA